jgi:5'-nucleotidase
MTGAQTRSIDLSMARILVTNDDGIDAPGIKILEKAARRLSDDVWVVAPETEQSAVAHGLTIRRPLRIRRVTERHFAVDGTPTDSVLLAIGHILKDRRPTICFSGVNRGANLGDDVTYSGTVAAAMEATLLGVPAIAFSQVFTKRDVVHWKTSETFVPKVARSLARMGWPENVLMNVNLPDRPPARVRGVKAVAQGRHKVGDELVENQDPRGQSYFWIGAMRQLEPDRPGTDLHAVAAGWIAVTPLHLDLTHGETLARMAASIGG